MSDAILDSAALDQRPTGIRSGLGEFWFYFRENTGAVIGLGVFVFVCLIAIFADLIAPHDPADAISATRCSLRPSGRRAATGASCSAPTRSAATCFRG